MPYVPSKPKIDINHKTFYLKSLAHDTYKVTENMHSGMPTKPLVPYHPTSYRNRLPIIDLKKPMSNSSTIELGDRSTLNKRHFLSTA